MSGKDTDRNRQEHRNGEIRQEHPPEQSVPDHASSLETVPDAADRLDMLACGTEPPAEADDLHVDRAGGDRVVVAVQRVENLLARKDPARFARMK